MASVDLKQNIVSALCKHLNLDTNAFLGDVDKDLKSLCAKILKSSSDGDAILKNNELMKWIAFAENILVHSEQSKALDELDEDLIKKSVLLGNGFTPSVADIIVFAAIHASLIGLSKSDKEKLPHLMRWMDYMQEKVDFGGLFERVLLEKVPFEPPVAKSIKKVETEPTVKKTVAEMKESTGTKVELKAAKNVDTKRVPAENQAAVEKKKLPKKEADGKDNEISVSLLKIQVGLVRKASQHPSADSLLVEEIDVGEGKHRQVVSGLAKYITPEQLTNRYVVLITNVKPSKLRDVMSEGLVLCASNQDHTMVEPLIVPEGAKIGECVAFSGHEGKPEDVLNPKKKQLEKITPHLFSDTSGIATFKGIPFMTSAGPCKSSIPNASIR